MQKQRKLRSEGSNLKPTAMTGTPDLSCCEKSILDQLQETNRPRSIKMDEVEVKISVTGELLEEYLYHFFGVASVKVRNLGFSIEDAVRMQQSILWHYVKYASQRSMKDLELGPYDDVAIAPFLSDILKNIGRTTDAGLGITLIPALKTEKDFTPMSRDEIQRLSAYMLNLQEVGVTFATRIPKDKEGSWDFMAMQIVKEEVQRHTHDAHPVYAVLASAVLTSELTSVLTPRVTYGSFSDLKRDVIGLVRA